MSIQSMSIQSQLQQKQDDIEKAVADFEIIRARLVDELAQAEQERDEKIARAKAERDAIAMAEKLKGYPAVLVKEHKTCAVCDGEMRPFQVVQGEQVVKYWACQFGNLSDAHDLIKV